jgi:hypothetical protein
MSTFTENLKTQGIDLAQEIRVSAYIKAFGCPMCDTDTSRDASRKDCAKSGGKTPCGNPCCHTLDLIEAGAEDELKEARRMAL